MLRRLSHSRKYGYGYGAQGRYSGGEGRDFHIFTVFFHDTPAFDVVAFTATQIPNVEIVTKLLSAKGTYSFSIGLPPHRNRFDACSR